MVIENVVKLLIPFVGSFFVGVALTPFVTSFLYKHEMWKKKAHKVDLSGNVATVFNELHKTRETGTPRMGGIVIWGSALVTIFLTWILAAVSSHEVLQKIDFLSRGQTWVPLAALLLGAGVGLVDDLLEVRARPPHSQGGLSLKKRLFVVGLLGLVVSSWFFFKLGVTGLGLPGGGSVELGLFFIPFFMCVMLAVYAGGVIDGIDGLAGGVFAAMFMSYAGIAFYQNQINLAAFCTLMTGSILSFLWFNIPPARFYMSETGSMALTVTLTIVAFMTDSLGGGYGVSVLPVIGILLILTILSNVIQVLSKKFRSGKKVFLIAPLHHHFEAKGWPPYKVTMRYWVIGIVFAILGMIIGIIG